MNRSDTGPFALIPVWVLDLPITHLALRIYACHADWADRNGSHTHGRVAIAQRVGCTVRAVDECHKALVNHGALQIEHRQADVGDPTSNRYSVVRVIPRGVAKQASLPSEADLATGSEASFSLTRSKDYEPLRAREGTPAESSQAFPERGLPATRMPDELRRHLPRRGDEAAS